MERYQPTFRGKPWTPGLRALHVYAVPNLEDLAGLVHGCRAVMKGNPIWCVPDEFLHMTLEVVTAADPSRITQAQRDALVTTLTEEVADIPAFDLTLGSPRACRNGVVLDTHPDDPINDLRLHVRTAVRRALGSDHDRSGHKSLPAHLSLGYSYADRSGDQLADALCWVRPSHVTTRISSVHVVDLLFEEVPVDGHLAWQLSWSRVAEIHLRPTDSRDR